MSYHGSGIVICRINPAKKQEFLLIKARWGAAKWGFPKGHIETRDISFLASALRETQEETGITKDQIQILGEPQAITYKIEKPTKKVPTGIKKVLMFTGFVGYSTPVELSKEHTCFNWLSFDEAKLVLSGSQQEFLNVLEKSKDIITASQFDIYR